MYYDINVYINKRGLDLNWRSAGDRHLLEALIGFDLEQTADKDEKKHLKRAMNQLFGANKKAAENKLAMARP